MKLCRTLSRNTDSIYNYIIELQIQLLLSLRTIEEVCELTLKLLLDSDFLKESKL